MPEPDFKALQKSWKSAKKTAKLLYDGWDRLYVDFSEAHEKVEFSVPLFPKFKLDLAPSLDNIQKGKDVSKYKGKVEKALKQYTEEIKKFAKAVRRFPAPENNDKQKAKKLSTKIALQTQLGVLNNVLAKIDEALKSSR